MGMAMAILERGAQTGFDLARGMLHCRCWDVKASCLTGILFCVVPIQKNRSQAILVEP